MISILVVAYMLNGKEVIKPLKIDPQDFSSCMVQDSGKPMIFLYKIYNGSFYYKSAENCKTVQDKIHKALWETK